jgi:cyclohexyl-isocyanide hydratase
MRIAFVAFDRMTLLDLVGFYDAVVRLKLLGFLPDLTWEVCARAPEVRDDRELTLRATATPASLKGFDLIYLPGGFGTRGLMHDRPFLDWLATGADCPLKVSVCTGALLWGALGALKGRRATTHPNAYDLLRPLCAQVVEDQRVVDEGPVVTARGVSASIDLGLHLCRRLAGATAAEKIGQQMDYPYGR